MSRCSCTHDHKEHAERGPKKPHSASFLYAKQLASTIIWRLYPVRNGPYTLYPTTEKAFCEASPLCTCTDCDCIKCQKEKRNTKRFLKKR